MPARQLPVCPLMSSTWRETAWVQQSPVQTSWCSSLLASTKLSLVQWWCPLSGLSLTADSPAGAVKEMEACQREERQERAERRWGGQDWM